MPEAISKPNSKGLSVFLGGPAGSQCQDLAAVLEKSGFQVTNLIEPDASSAPSAKKLQAKAKANSKNAGSKKNPPDIAIFLGPTVSNSFSADCEVAGAGASRSSGKSGGPTLLTVGASETGTKLPQPFLEHFTLSSLPPSAEIFVPLVQLLSTDTDPSGNRLGDLSAISSSFALTSALSLLKERWKLRFQRGLRQGMLHFESGMLIAGELGSLDGEAAFRQLLLWSDGTFSFERCEKSKKRKGPGESQLEIDRDQLFDRALLYLHKLGEETTVVASDRFEQNRENVGNGAPQLPREVQEIVDLFDGARTVADVIEDSPYRAIEVVKVVGELVKRGILTQLKRPGSSANEGEPALLVEEWFVNGQYVEGTIAGEQPLPPQGKLLGQRDGSSASGQVGAVGKPTQANRPLVRAASVSGEFEPVIPNSEPSVSVLPPSIEVNLPVLDSGEEKSSRSESQESSRRKTTGSKTSKNKEPLFTDYEKAFFEGGTKPVKPPTNVESFEDLDADLDLPKTFWGRFFRDPNASLAQNPAKAKPHRPRKRGRTKSEHNPKDD